MGDLLIRNVPAEVLDNLKASAKRRGRSLQAEALAALQRGARPTGADFIARVQALRDPKIDVEAGIRAIREARDER